MLKVEGIETWYGAIQALKGVSLDVKQGEIVALLGANGAGKSTTIKTITGLLKPDQGQDRVHGPGHHRDGSRGHRRDRHRLRAGGTAHLPWPHRHGQPDAGRDAEQAALQGGDPEDLERVFDIFPHAQGVQGGGWAGSSPAASSRCWPSAAG